MVECWDNSSDYLIRIIINYTLKCPIERFLLLWGETLEKGWGKESLEQKDKYLIKLYYTTF